MVKGFEVFINISVYLISEQNALASAFPKQKTLTCTRKRSTVARKAWSDPYARIVVSLLNSAEAADQKEK